MTTITFIEIVGWILPFCLMLTLWHASSLSSGDDAGTPATLKHISNSISMAFLFLTLIFAIDAYHIFQRIQQREAAGAALLHDLNADAKLAACAAIRTLEADTQSAGSDQKTAGHQ